jgi:hypothetical protein
MAPPLGEALRTGALRHVLGSGAVISLKMCRRADALASLGSRAYSAVVE